MKLHKIAIISAAILVTMLVGAFAFNALAPAKELKLKVKWRPPAYAFGNPVPNPWRAEIFFAPLRDLNEIDTSTLRLEGGYLPSGESYLLNGNPPRLAVPFNGYDVLGVAMSKLGHMSPGTYVVYVEVYGNLKPEYGGSAFSGNGPITLMLPDPSPP